MTKRITGRHMAIIFVAFFGVIAAVNFTMARLAVGGFGGTIVDNSYVASQRYEEWRDQARTQEAYGWQVAARLDADRHVEVMVEGVTGAIVTATAEHRYDKDDDVVLALEPVAGGYRSTAPLDAGWYRLRVIVQSGSREARYLLPLDA